MILSLNDPPTHCADVIWMQFPLAEKLEMEFPMYKKLLVKLRTPFCFREHTVNIPIVSFEDLFLFCLTRKELNSYVQAFRNDNTE